jgi:5-methylcytosine-specific restriction protein A
VKTRAFKRNADVIAEVLIRANGVCEKCDKKAPFLRSSDGTPFLEVHHLVRLADGGKDTVENAKAVCPNCHRELHYG